VNDWIDPRTRIWALIAVLGGIGLFLGIEIIEEPDATVLDLLFELLEISPIVLTSVGTVLLFRVSSRQHDEHLKVIRDLELARAQGQRWRTESRVALLLIKGLSHKEIATVRAVSERTVREQARSIYSKAGLTGRTALSAFFLEDLLAPIESLE